MRRCLINWDYGSSGTWLLPSNPNACQPSIEGVLSPGLEPDQVQVMRWEAMKLDLAERAQGELGEEWEVLYQDAGAWTWVRRPNGGPS